MLASLQHDLDNGDRDAVASYARSFGLGAARDMTTPDNLEPRRTALRYLELSDAAQPNDTTTLVIGSTNVALTQRLANAPAKRCDTVRELGAAVVDAQIPLPKVGRVFPYSDQLSKAACRTKDEEGPQSAQ